MRNGIWLAASALVLAVCVGEGRAGGFEASSSGAYGEFQGLLEGGAFERIGAGRAPDVAEPSRRLVAQVSGPRRRREPLDLWTLSVRLSPDLKIDWIRPSPRTMIRIVEQAWHLSTTLGSADVVFFPKAGEAETLRVKLVRPSHGKRVYRLYQGRRWVADVDSDSRLYFTLSNNVLFYTSSRKLHEAAGRALR